MKNVFPFRPDCQSVPSPEFDKTTQRILQMLAEATDEADASNKDEHWHHAGLMAWGLIRRLRTIGLIVELDPLKRTVTRRNTRKGSAT